MGERRRERTSKRRRTVLKSGGKSCSDSEVAQSRLKDRRGKSRDHLPWPRTIETISVDELARYRRGRVPNSPKDTLGEEHRGERDNVYENLVTEYRRSFRAISEDSLLHKRHIKHEDDEVDRAAILPVPSLIDSTSAYIYHEKPPDVRSMETDTEMSQVPPEVPRPAQIRKRAGMKRVSEFYGDTESSNYKIYEGYHKPELTRRPTSLKMEGDMRGVTEQCEKFIEWLNVTRPEPARIPTNLKLEGHLETSTENHDQYVPFIGARRPEILRQSAQLRLEGESSFHPEYTDVFKPRAYQERRAPKLPVTHLESGGEFTHRTENSQNFIDPRGAVPMNHSHNLISEDMHNQEDNQNHKEEHMQMLVSKLEDLQAPPLETPEYRDAFKDFPRERPKLLKPEDEIGRADGSKVHPSPHPGKFSTKIDHDPEYQSKYLDKDRAIHRKPPISSRRPSVGSSTYGRRIVPDLRQYDATSEVRSQYIPYGHVPRVETLRMPVTLRPEGSMDLQPEYRDAYCSRRNNTVVESNNRRRDRSNSDSRKRDNNWINNNNGEQFGMINAEHDQDAFQVLQTRVHDENLIGKPPPAIRRGSRSMQPQRPTHLDFASPGTLKNRSPSPTYRLHVCNVDDEPRGFGRTRRRSSSLRQKITRSPSPNRDIHDDKQRTYSPSFGRESLKHRSDDDSQAFIVLNSNNSVTNNRPVDNRTRRLDRNANIDTISNNRGRGSNKTPTNWMQPWYDNTSTS